MVVIFKHMVASNPLIGGRLVDAWSLRYRWAMLRSGGRCFALVGDASLSMGDPVEIYGRCFQM